MTTTTTTKEDEHNNIDLVQNEANTTSSSRSEIDVEKNNTTNDAQEAPRNRFGLTKEEEEERTKRNQAFLPSEKKLGYMSIEERWEFARQYKESGNVFFREGKYSFAYKNYQETVTYLRHGLRMGETDREGIPFGAKATDSDPESKAIMASCNSNMAACALKLSKFEDAVKHATTALEQTTEDKAKAKIFFRRSKAYFELEKIENAYDDIVKASQYDNKDTAIKIHLQKVQKEYKGLKKEEHAAAKSLWQGKLGDAGDKSADTATTAEETSKATTSAPIPAGSRLFGFMGRVFSQIWTFITSMLQ